MRAPRTTYSPAVKKVGAIMSVVICIRKASPLYGHSLDHVRPAQPINSAMEVELVKNKAHSDTARCVFWRVVAYSKLRRQR